MRPLVDGGAPPIKEEDHQRQQAFIRGINLEICKHYIKFAPISSKGSDLNIPSRFYYIIPIH